MDMHMDIHVLCSQKRKTHKTDFKVSIILVCTIFHLNVHFSSKSTAVFVPFA